jgi:ubiquitin carboxyl-terminal hydrolase L5
MDNWCTIESDPGVFTQLIEDLGVEKVEVEEVYSLQDKEYMTSLQPIYGFIFLFKWTGQSRHRVPLLNYDPELFFARQVITNACATQALLSVLLNSKGKIQLTEELENLRNFGLALDPYSNGLILGESEKIRTVHNSFARPEPFLHTGSNKGGEKEDAFHFVAYIHHNGRVYEIDGLQEGPILIAEDVKDENWVDIATQEISSRIETYAVGEIKFNLLVLKASNQSLLESQKTEKEARILGILQQCQTQGIDPTLEHFDLSDIDKDIAPILSSESNAQTLIAELNTIVQERANIIWELSSHKAKLKAQKEENERRKHNYLPLIFDLFKLAAESGQLETLYAEALKK